MAGSIQCVFLIDEAVFCLFRDINCQLCYRLRLAILRLLCYLSSSRARSPSCVRWSYKLFDSEGPKPQVSEKQALSEFCLENFEDFEACLALKAERKRTLKTLNTRAQELGLNSHSVDLRRQASDILSLAFHQLYADYVWDLPDISSPIKTLSQSGTKSHQQQHENYIFVFASFDIFLSSATKSDPFKKLLPKSLHETLNSLVQLVWIDTSNSTLQMVPKISKLLPLELISGDTSDLKTNMFLPMSALMSCLLNPKERKHSKSSDGSDSLLTLSISGKHLCQLSLTSFRKTYDTEECTFSKGDVLGSLPASWISKATVLQCSSMIASLVYSTECTSPQIGFADLLQKLKRDSRILVLQLYKNEYPTNLSVLQPFGSSNCTIILLTPGMTLKSLVAFDHQNKRKFNHHVLAPSYLEVWAVAKPSSRFLMENEPSKPSFRRHSLKDMQHCYERLAPILTQKKTRRKNSKSFGKFGAIAEQDFNSSGNICEELDSKITDFSEEAKSVPQETNKLNFQNQDSHLPLSELHELYGKAIDGTTPVERVSEVLIWELHNFARAKNTIVCDLAAQEQFLLTAKMVGDKHEALGDSKGLARQRELQLQALLRLELQHLRYNQEAHVTQSDIQELEFAEKAAIQEVVVLLRTFSFLAGALELSTFLLQTVKQRYTDKLHHILQEISEELNVPLSSDTDSSSDDESFAVGSQPHSNCSQSSYSSLSSVSQQPKSTGRKSWGRSLSMLNVSGSRRQIKVPRSLVNSTASSQSPTSGKNVKKTKNKRSSVKKSKARILDEKQKTGKKRACRNLLEKLDQTGQPTLLKSKSDYSPVKTGTRSPRRQTQGNPRTPRRKSKSSSSPKSKTNSSPRTPKHKIKPTFSGFTPNKTFPDLMGTPDNKQFFSPRLRSRSSPRTPRQNSSAVSSGFTPSARFPDLTNTPDHKNSCSPLGSRTPKQNKSIVSGFTPSVNFPDLIKTPESRYRTPRSHNKSNISTRTPNSNSTDGLTDSPASCTRSKSHLLFSPASRTPLRSAQKLSRRSQSSSCIRKLTLDSPTKIKSGVTTVGTPKKESEKFTVSPHKTTKPSLSSASPSKRDFQKVRTPKKRSGCFDSVSPSRQLRTTIHSFSSLFSSRSKRSFEKDSLDGSGSLSPEISTCVTINPSNKVMVSNAVLDTSPLKSCLKQSKLVHGDISTESPRKQVKVSEHMKNHENLSSMDDIPREQESQISYFGIKPKRTNCRISNSDLCSESSDSPVKTRLGKNVSIEGLLKSKANQISQSDISSELMSNKQILSQIHKTDIPQDSCVQLKKLSDQVPKVLLDKLCYKSFQKLFPLQEEKNKFCSPEAKLLTPEKVPVLQLQKLPESSDRSSTKTSPVLSMRWPQRKRKLSSMQKKREDFNENKISLEPKDHVITPPSKKLQVNNRYTSPSTISILHLTTSPVISCSKSFKSKK